jgi:cytoskeletal protein CcmA (bactofilin family)
MSLWQKDQESTRTAPEPSTASTASPSAPRAAAPSGKTATIGASVQINGELTGQEDLIIDGKIEGKIIVSGHNLTVGNNGHVNAEVKAKCVQVNGEVSGNITADDKVEISPTGTVLGDITAPRVALADGSSFKGSIDMSSKSSGASNQNSTQVNRDVQIPAGAKS